MGEYAASYNTLVDAHNDQSDEVTCLKAKVADLKNRSHRSNVKLHGIPETMLSAQLNQYTQDFMAACLPSVPASELITDGIHRLPKQPYLSDNVPRDVLMQCISSM